MKKAFSILIGFIHDFAAGCWAACLLVTYWLERQVVPIEMLGTMLVLETKLFFAGVACVILVLATGAGRTFTYVSNAYGEDAEKMRRRMLMVKHIVLLIVFGLGTYWQYTVVFR